MFLFQGVRGTDIFFKLFMIWQIYLTRTYMTTDEYNFNDSFIIGTI